MAGAKETPRQKMIGMMYRPDRTFALNISKEVLNGFVKVEIASHYARHVERKSTKPARNRDQVPQNQEKRPSTTRPNRSMLSAELIFTSR